MKDFYRILDVPKDADQAAIKKAFKALARKYHPDINQDPGAEERFKDFTPRAICDTATHTEALFSFSAPSRAAVDEIVRAAIAAGGRQAEDPEDHGFMYGWSFYDLDGHGWQVIFMDPSHVQPA